MKALILLLLVSFNLQAKQIASVVAYQVTKTTNNLSFVAVGKTAAYQRINIQMPTKGLIKKLPFQSGDVIKKGDVIVYQNSDLLKLQKKRDQLVINKTASKSKKKNYAFQDAILQLAQTKVLFKQKQFTAPFSGVLGSVNVSKGALITPQTIISTLDDISKIRILFDVSESNSLLIKKGGLVNVITKSLKQRTITGKISYISSRFNKSTRLLPVEAVIDNSKGSIKTGVFVDVEVRVTNKQSNIYIPYSAVLTDKSNQYIYKIKNNKITKTFVTLGKRKAKQVQILTGLKGNELIIARALPQLKDQTKVKIIDYLKSH